MVRLGSPKALLARLLLAALLVFALGNCEVGDDTNDETLGQSIDPVSTKGRLGFTGGDDWEPEIANDGSGHVYVVWTHFPGNTTIDPTAGAAKRVRIQVSNDNGQTFSAPRVVADLPGGLAYSDQGDATIAVSSDGSVYVSFLAWGLTTGVTDVYVAKSTDFGATFPSTSVKKVNSACANCDHEWPAARGNNVYVMYAEGASHWLSRSSDGGQTWTESLVLSAGKTGFPEGAVVDAAGNAWFAWADCRKPNCTGSTAVDYRVSKTLAGTSTTTFAAIANAPQGPDCPFPSCGFAFFGPQGDIALDAGGNMYFVWQDGAAHTTAKSPTIVNLSKCIAGRDCSLASSWTSSGRIDDKQASGCAGAACYALFPRVEGGASGHVSVVWMDDRLGAPIDHNNGWNVFLRSSIDGGATWTTAGQDVSPFDATRSESQPNGFKFPYGDYQGITIIPGPNPKAAMVWGEGSSFTGGPTSPGHIVYQTQTVP